MGSPPGPNYGFRCELAEILGIKVEDLPVAFRGSVVALKDGAFKELRARYPGADPHALADFEHRYTTSYRYVRKIIYGRSLHDIDGKTIQLIGRRRRRRARFMLRHVPEDRLGMPQKFATNRCVESVATNR